jgi:hypothetical protein
MDTASIESEYRRIMKSRRSLIDMTRLADRLFQKINEFYGTLTDENAKAQFRADYVSLAEKRFGVPESRSETSSAKLTALMLDHARNLKEVEGTKEKLNKELGDF